MASHVANAYKNVPIHTDWRTTFSLIVPNTSITVKKNQDLDVMYCHDLCQDVTVLKNAKDRSESLQTLASQQCNSPNFSCRLRMPQSYKAPQIQRLSTDSRALCEKWTPRLGAGLFQGDLGWWNTMKILNAMKRVFKHVVTCCQLNMESLGLEPLCGPCLVSRCNLSCKAPFTSGGVVSHDFCLPLVFHFYNGPWPW